MSVLSVTGISYLEAGKTALQDISFEQKAFQKLAIAGETGSGKTTLLKIIAGLQQPVSGVITLNGERIKGPDEQLLPGNKDIAYLSQHFELRNNYRVHEILDMANRLLQPAADKIYEICRISHLRHRWTDELSGGEKQRIALARLLSMSPRWLLLDEPFSNLDPMNKTMIKTVIADACDGMQITCILVSHDAGDILSWADTLVLLRDGAIVQRGTTYEIYNKPMDTYCAGLLGPYNLLEVKGQNDKLFLRPEKIMIAAKEDPGTQAIVKNILFWGSYYTIDLLLEGQVIRAQTNTAAVSIGQEVSLSFPEEEPWHLSR